MAGEQCGGTPGAAREQSLLAAEVGDDARRVDDDPPDVPEQRCLQHQQRMNRNPGRCLAAAMQQGCWIVVQQVDERIERCRARQGIDIEPVAVR